ncbi:hypothetical protein FDZ71_18125, partial [bacterium]
VGSCLDYYYPGSCLVTGRDIITLWVARMQIAGLYLLGDVPFTDCFIHANIQDGKGERMSKSKGNGIDPADIIEKYGADAMRYVLCDMQTGTQDIRLPVQAVSPYTGKLVDLATAKHGRTIFTYLDPETGKEFDVMSSMPELPTAKIISERFEVGRAFATNGPILFFHVDGKTPSLTEPLAKPSSVEIEIRALSSARLSFVDLVRNGRVYRRFDCARRREFAVTLRLKLRKSCWIAARAFEENEVTVRFAHTDPAFLEVGRPIVPSTREALYYKDWCEELLQALRDNPGRSRSEGQREKVERVYERAISFYEKLARGAGTGLHKS